jgi:hypothetical protein
MAVCGLCLKGQHKLCTGNLLGNNLLVCTCPKRDGPPHGNLDEAASLEQVNVENPP